MATAKKNSAEACILGRNIRIYRERNQLTQEELAEETGYSVSYIGLLERGERLPKIPVLLDLCEVLKATPNSLLGYTSPRKKSPVDDFSNIDFRLLDMTEDISQMEKKDQKVLFEMLEQIIRTYQKRL